MNKKITKKGYRTLAVIWTLAAASMGVAFVRRLAEFNLFLLLLFLLSLLTASNFWKCFRRADQAGDAPALDGRPNPQDPLKLFDDPPRFADNPELFDDLPEPAPGGPEPTDNDPNQDSEENDHE